MPALFGLKRTLDDLVVVVLRFFGGRFHDRFHAAVLSAAVASAVISNRLGFAVTFGGDPALVDAELFNHDTLHRIRTLLGKLLVVSSGTGAVGVAFKHQVSGRILVHLIDVATLEPENILSSYITVNHELEKHNQELSKRKQLLVLNKMDTEGSEEKARLFMEAIGDMEVLSISALKDTDMNTLLSRILILLEGS